MLLDEEASRHLNALTGGDPDETLCSRLWRERWRKPIYWWLIRKLDRPR